MSELHFLRLGSEHIDAIAAVEKASFEHGWSRESYREELEDNQLARYFGLELDGRLVAFAGFWLIGDEGHITNVAVDPEFRRRGLGEYLLRRLYAACLAEGGRKMTLEVRAGNESALALYDKLGFVCVGSRPGYYDEPKEDALILWWQDDDRHPLSKNKP